MEDRRVDRIRDDDRLAQLEAELAMLGERELRLEDRRGRERGVDLGDPRVGAVVEPAVRADRPIDPVHHPRTPASEAPQATEVEVERVEEAHGRAAGDRPGLDHEPATLELVYECAEELVPSPSGRRRELVEEREVGAAAARAEQVELASRQAGRAARETRRPAKRPSHDGVSVRRFQTSNPGYPSATLT